MEPNWQPNQTNRQGTSGARSSVWQGDGNTVPQRPAGSRRISGNTTRQYTNPQGIPGQGNQPWIPTGGQAPQGYPSAAPTPSNPWATGPVDPFDEPSEAPELRDQRSDHLYNKEDRFWDRVEGGKHTGRNAKSKPNADSHTMRWMILILVVLVAVGAVVYGAVFQVREISVQGAITIDAREIIKLSGISEGMNTFSINDDQVEKNIESNRYLSFVCVDKQLPDRVVIQVRERIPVATVSYCGIRYTMDNRGMVLEESMDTSLQPGMINVAGLQVHDCRVGQTIGLYDQFQMNVYTAVMIELKVMSALGVVDELDLTNMDNLFIVSDDFTVRLGAAENLHAKLRSMLLTLEYLKGEGYSSGTVDVSSPVYPTYIPES